MQLLTYLIGINDTISVVEPRGIPIITRIRHKTDIIKQEMTDI